MKKVLALLLAATVLAGFSACGKDKQPETEETTEPITTVVETTGDEALSTLPRLLISDEPYTITAKDGFDNAGVTALICGATANYSFKSSSPETTWKIFLFDEEFTDGARYLSQAKIPSLDGDGNLLIEAGKYIYVLCSESAFTGGVPSDATLTINYADINPSTTTEPATDMMTTEPTTVEATTQPTTDAPTTTQPATTQPTTAAPGTLRKLIINNEPYVVTAKDGFDNAGVTGLICDATATYSFKSSSPDTTWKVYVLDEEFIDGARYLPQAKTPALEGDGDLQVEAGQYIYILCSESTLTGDAPSDATLSIHYAS